MDSRLSRVSSPPLTLADPPKRRPSEERRILEASFQTGRFADPPAKKAMMLGGDLLTKKHVALISDLRREGARLAYENQNLADKSAMYERRYRVAKINTAHMKEQVNLLQARYRKLEGELEANQRFLRKLDELFSGEKTQRMARALSLGTEEIDSAQLVEVSPTPHLEFRNPFEG